MGGAGRGWKAAGQVCWLPPSGRGPPGTSVLPHGVGAVPLRSDPTPTHDQAIAVLSTLPVEPGRTLCAKAPQFGPSASLICVKPWCLPDLSSGLPFCSSGLRGQAGPSTVARREKALRASRGVGQSWDRSLQILMPG